MRMLVGAAMIVAMAAPAMAGDIPPGASTMVRIEPGESNRMFSVFDYQGDQDAFRVELKAGQNYGLYVGPGCNGVAVDLFDRNFRRLATAKPAENGIEALEYIPKYSGLHYLRITNLLLADSPDCSEGDYSYGVWVTNSCAPSRYTRCMLKLGKEISSVLYGQRDKDWWAIDIPIAGTYTIYSDATFWNWGGVLGLRTADTKVIAEVDGSEGRPSCELDRYLCIRARLSAGRHYVTLRMPASPDREPYQLLVTREAN